MANSNTSARIVKIEDARAPNGTSPYKTFELYFDPNLAVRRPSVRGLLD